MHQSGDTPSVDESVSQDQPRPRPRPKPKPTACNRCHVRKVKCSGGHPCGNCRSIGKAPECSYPRRNKIVKVSQRYLDDLVAENQRLRIQATSTGNPAASGYTRQPLRDRADTSNNGATANDPVYGAPSLNGDKADGPHAPLVPTLDDQPWFFDMNIPHTPILISEAADAAFATRFRQAVFGCRQSHIPRVNYATDELLLTLSDTDRSWPSPSRARFLVDVALRFVSRCYHIVRRSAILEGLEQTLKSPSRSSDSLFKSKLWALFALGEMYSTRSAGVAGKRFPGIAYFARATRILRIVSERPRIDAVEIRLLLSFYSLALNRRHSAYTLAGSALRLSVVMGLHLNVPVSHLSDVAAREHRCRVWWTAYTFDRMWASKLGNPYAIEDCDIRVDLPSDQRALEGTAAAGDFADAAYVVARVNLARLAGRIIQSIYGRRAHQESLSQRVQTALRGLRGWIEELPEHLHIDRLGSRTPMTSSTSNLPSSDPHPTPALKPTSLHLSFNQTVINATRPILLHVLRTHTASWAPAGADSGPSSVLARKSALDTDEVKQANSQVPPASIPTMALTVAETCTRCARHSAHLLTEAWIDGSYATFDYFYTQYLFSAATVLAVSSLLPDGGENRSDGEHFDAAADILSQLKDSGSYAAEEFCQHIDAIKVAIQEAQSRRAGGLGPGEEPSRINHSNAHLGSLGPSTLGTSSGNTSCLNGSPSHTGGLVGPQLFTSESRNATAGMAMLEPSLQELLAQPSFDLQFIDASIYTDESYSQMLYWPDITPDASSWMQETWTS